MTAMPVLEINGKKIRVTVERRDVRYVYLRLGPRYELRLVVPNRSAARVEDILEKKRSWVENKVAEMSRRRTLMEDSHVLYEGKPIRPHAFQARNPNVRLYRHIIHLYGPTDSDRKMALLGFLHRQTERKVRELATLWAAKIGVRYAYLGFRETRKWGQCSRRGELVFNDKLICLPNDLVEYVVVHELLHLRHFNHSARFATELTRLVPRQRNLGRELMRYTASW